MQLTLPSRAEVDSAMASTAQKLDNKVRCAVDRLDGMGLLTRRRDCHNED